MELSIRVRRRKERGKIGRLHPLHMYAWSRLKIHSDHYNIDDHTK
jgi:hypothetical protein